MSGKVIFLWLFLGISFPVTAFSQDKVLPPVAEKIPPPAPQAPVPPANVFAEQFYMMPPQRIENTISEVQGFLFVEKPVREGEKSYAIVTDFGNGVLRSHLLRDVTTLADVKKWVEANLKTAKFEGVEIKRLPLPNSKGEKKNAYWVGHRSFESATAAKAQIAMAKAAVNSQGGNFPQMVEQAQAYVKTTETEPVIEIKTPAQFEKEEKLVLKMLDQLDVGNELFGPFQGVPAGEPIIWQSFGETTWRSTNLTKKNYNAQVGFWTNRLVFNGIRAPLNTIDPFVEVTPTMESVGPPFKSYAKFFAGLEWRPLARNVFLNNFRPMGIPLLDWVKNFRLFVMYGDRKPLKDEFSGSANHNLIWGTQIFYEWGIDLPGSGEGRPTTIGDFLREYVWGEYFGDYHFETTNFSPENDKFNAFIFNSSIILGFRLPGIPLPDNPINDRLVLMPYMRFEHVNNSELSFFYQNQFFVAAGVRWMPFRTYRFKENEWLSKAKFFIEYVGVGSVFNTKQGDNDSTGPVTHDIRVGVNFSSRRF